MSVRLCYSYPTPVSVRATSNPARTRSRARIVTRSNWSVPVNGGIVRKCRIGLFRRRAICSCMREVMLKLTIDYKMTKHMLNNCTLKESRTWLLVCTRHSYFIPFNHEHPVSWFVSSPWQDHKVKKENDGQHEGIWRHTLAGFQASSTLILENQRRFVRYTHYCAVPNTYHSHSAIYQANHTLQKQQPTIDGSRGAATPRTKRTPRSASRFAESINTCITGT